MAKTTLKLPDEQIAKIKQLGTYTDEVLTATLEAGAAVVEKAVRNRMHSVIGTGTRYKSRSTGELEQSLGISAVRVNSAGEYDIKVGFAGKRLDGTSNGMIAGILERGKHGQAPKPFIGPAKRESKSAAEKAMAETFDKEASKYL